MKYPMTLSEDLKYLAAYYQWTDADKAEIRAAFTNCEPMVRYFTNLAAAHRAGYEQDAGNGFVRLREWCEQKGLADPYGKNFDVVALDMLKAVSRL